MASMDVFKSSLFSTISLSGYVNKKAHVPTFLGELGLFEPRPVRTTDIFVESKNETLSLIPVSQRGGPSTNVDGDKRNGRKFETVRLSQDSRITAREVQNIRADNSETELKSVQGEVEMRRQKMDRNLAMTEEHHRLGAINGLLLDADGTTVIEDFFDAFGIAQPTFTDYAFGTETTNVRDISRGIERELWRASKGAMVQGVSSIVALCGDDFYDNYTSHATVKPAFDRWETSQSYNDATGVFQSFRHGNINWVNYRGTDDNSTIAIPTNECRFVIKDGTETFVQALAPGEGYGQVNQLGQRRYADIVLDRGRTDPRYADVFLDSYPLFLNQRPDLLRKARIQ